MIRVAATTAALVALLVTSPSRADVVDTAGPVTFAVGSGSSLGIASAANQFALGGGASAISATVASDGSLSSAAANIETVMVKVGDIPVSAEVEITDASAPAPFGSIDPLSGSVAMSFSVVIRLESSAPSWQKSTCRIPTFTVAPTAGAAGVAYDSTSGRATLVDSAVGLRASEGCGIYASAVDGAFGLPGTATLSLILASTPVLVGS